MNVSSTKSAEQIMREANLVTARKLLHMNCISRQQIAQACSLTLEEVDQLDKETNPFPALDAWRNHTNSENQKK